MWREDAMSGAGPREAAGGRCRRGCPRRRPWARGRLAVLMGAALGLPLVPIPERPPPGAPMIRVYCRPGSVIRGVVFSPNGRTLATLDGRGLVRLESIGRDGIVPGPPPALRGTAAAFSPDGRRLAVGGAGPDVLSIEPDRPGDGRPMGLPVGEASELRFSPDGRILAVAGRGSTEILLWDVEAGRPRMALRGHAAPVAALIYSPDGRALASAAFPDPAILIWDLDTGRPRHRLIAPGIIAMAFTPDGRALATVCGRGREVRLWDARTGDPLGSLAGRGVPILSAAFSPDGRTLAAAAGDGTVGLWDVATGRERRRLDGLASLLGHLAFSPDGRTLAATGHDDAIRLWDLGAPGS